MYEEAQSWTPFLSVEHARNAGRTLATLHAASAGYGVPARRAAPLVTSFEIFADDNPWPKLTRYVESQPALQAYLAKREWQREVQDTFLPLHTRLRPLLGVFEPLWTHNDFHGSNLLWSSTSSEAKVTSIFDVGLANRTNAIHDVATAVERSGVEWLQIHDASRDPLHLQQIDAMLSGYEESHPFSREEAEALVALLPLVHAEFALSEADYFLRVLRSEEKADLAYIGYFLGHARWFGTGAGRRLLEHLQIWAERHRYRAETRATTAAGIAK